MMQVRNRLVHLHRCRHMTRRLIRKTLSIDPSLKKMYKLTKGQISDLLALPNDKAFALYQDLHNSTLHKQAIYDIRKYQVITILDKTYPPMLKPINDPPIVLYAIGNTALLTDAPALSVVGTRNPSSEAKEKIRQILTPLVKKEWVIVSGMAKGIDSLAHWLPLAYEGKTIAVLGGGFNHIYPRQNITLFNQIEEKGLILSEYPPHILPRPYHFPERNRIISGLGFGTLVIEATEKSGTLITVDQALDQGREVYAVPGSPLMPQTKGCHRMIQDGAKLIMNAEELLEDWDLFGPNWDFV